MVELNPQGRAADSARFLRPLATAGVAEPNFALHCSGNRARRARGDSAPRLLHDSVPASVPLQNQIEASLQYSLGHRAWIGVRKCRARRLEFLQEPFRVGDVKACQLSAEWLRGIRAGRS